MALPRLAELRDRPIHALLVEMLEAYLAAKGIKLLPQLAPHSGRAATFQHNGQRYTVTVALAEEHLDGKRSRGGST
jgi:hypothetical protein